ncbi:ATP-grasp domain-containing protein [Candidatus Woesearchaeota archaeon]|jgi:predicted ATP-grasp superfamily ATP-dependent carboligase|nr:ATP-grasp domain-containing protein [Candidatus Woesearchaeota archaeon]
MVCIITFARSWQTLIATRALGKAGIKVVTCDTDKFATAFFSKYSVGNFLYTNPAINEKKFILDLIEKCKYYKKKYNEEVMILPIHKETYVISKYRKRVEKHAKICVDDFENIMKVHNKANIPSMLKRYKIRHPKTFVIKDIIELYKIVPKLKFPVFIKVLESAASIGLKKVDDRDMLIYEYKKLVDEFNLKPKDYPILQEGVPGKDYCVTALMNKGKLKAMMTYVNIKCNPYKSGPGVYRKNVKSIVMEREAKKLLTKIKWHGLIEIDFRMTGDNKPYLIECNPRFWGGLNQSVASNVNYPLLAYKIAMEGDCETVKKYDKHVRTENLTTAVLALMDEIKKDERKQKELKKLDKYWKKIFIDKKGFTNNIQQFFKQIALINKKQYTLKIIKEFFDRRKLVKDDIFDKKDPFVVMGIFYPIHLMLKYGKIDKMMLTGENPKK